MKDPFKALDYRPRLSFVGLKYVGLVILTISQLAVWALCSLSNAGKTDTPLYSLALFLRGLGQITVPLIFVSLMSCIFHKRDREQLPHTVAQYALFALLFYGAEIYLLENFVEPILTEMATELLLGYPGLEGEILGDVVSALLGELFYYLFAEISNFNIYVDCLLCALFYLFAFYTPRCAKTRTHILLFRSLCLLPAAYIAGSFVLHGLVSFGQITLDLRIGALLPHKKLSLWLFFGGVLLYLKLAERTAAKHPGGPDPFRRNAAVICLLLLLTCILDLALSNVAALKRLGFGKSVSMAFGAPVLALFDVRKSPRFPLLGRLVPLYYLINYGMLFLLFSGGGGLIGYFLAYALTSRLSA